MGLRKRLIDRLGPKEGWHIVAARYANERDEARAVIAAARELCETVRGDPTRSTMYPDEVESVIGRALTTDSAEPTSEGETAREVLDDAYRITDRLLNKMRRHNGKLPTSEWDGDA